MELKNFMEELVFQQLQELLSRQPQVCSCERCKLDMAALALNQLPPLYVVTDQGKTYTRTHMLENQFATDVTSAIIKAIDIVKNRPKHMSTS